jgi:acyl carrier protein
MTATNDPESSVLSLEAFVDVFSSFFELDQPIDSLAGLVEDLGFDSLQMYEILLLLEEAGHHEVPDTAVSQLVTVGDVYETYVLYRGHRDV